MLTGFGTEHVDGPPPLEKAEHEKREREFGSDHERVRLCLYPFLDIMCSLRFDGEEPRISLAADRKIMEAHRRITYPLAMGRTKRLPTALRMSYLDQAQGRVPVFCEIVRQLVPAACQIDLIEIANEYGAVISDHRAALANA